MANGKSIRQLGLCLALTLALFIRGHQGFFVKHTSSGLCLQASSKYWQKGLQTGRLDYQWGPIYSVYFRNTCLHPDAQFRFFETYRVLYNIGKDGTFLARQDKLFYKKQFKIYHSTQPPNTTNLFIFLPNFFLKQTRTGALKLNSGYCPTPVEQGTNPKSPLIPINGSLVYETNICDKEEHKFTFGQVTKEGENMAVVHCSPKQVMKVVMAEYGRFSNGETFVYQNDSDCSLPSACIVKSKCDNNASCNMNVNNSLFQNDPCQETKQLHMEYICVDSLTKNPITTVDDVRLSSDGLPNEGFVEVFENGTWKKVADKNMQRSLMAKALCKFLGYNDRDGEVVLKNATSGDKILSGDLYCHKNSCCANLNQSTAAKEPQLPFVSCAICSEPLMLRNTTKFPNTNIKASPSSKANDVRISNSGWCFSKDEKAYLEIDLTLDYVISQIATFGDADRNKWMTSYTLKYRTNEMNLNKDGEIQVLKANINGFDVAVENLSKVYARFLKIIPNGAGCTRIELCGHRLLPGPPENLKIVRVESRSATISWKAPLIKGDGDIFYIITEKQGLFNKINQTQLEKNLIGLKPITTYTVQIFSTNNHGKTENAYRILTFKTNESVPDGPPLSVVFASRTTKSLTVSWKPPKMIVRNGNISSYNVCYSTNTNTETCHDEILKPPYLIENLNPATKYFVRVSAGTKVGYGVFSEKIIAITNGKSVVPTNKTYSSLSLSLEKPQKYIKSILVIIQNTRTPTNSSDSYQSNELKPYSTGSSGPYVTAGFSDDKIPDTFVVGDGKPYELNNTTYSNQPLKEDTDYILFVRFIETEKVYYSTVWSTSVKTYQRPPAPGNLNAVSLSRNSLHISWQKPNLTNHVILRAFTICYKEMQKLCNESGPTSSSFKIDGLKSSTMYEISIRSQTNIGDSLDRTLLKITNAEPLSAPKKFENGYLVSLRKPTKEDIIRVDLIILQLQSNTTIPEPPERIVLDSRPSSSDIDRDIAFSAASYNISDFGNNKVINVSLQVAGNKQRRRRDAEQKFIYPNKTYRFSQWNYKSLNEYSASYWSDPIAFSSEVGDKDDLERAGDGNGGGNFGVVIGITVTVVIILALVFVGFIFWRRRRSSDKPDRHFVCDEDKQVNSFANGIDQKSDQNDGEIETQLNEGIYSNEAGLLTKEAHRPVPIAEFAHYVNEMKANDGSEFETEYDELPSTNEICWDVSKKPINKKKNRYGNIVTYDHSRVVLSGGVDNDYINASFINGIKPDSYIACQGPTKASLNDMWRMVWEQNCYSIIMVTSLTELGKPKCEKYWPDQGSQMFEDIQVTLTKTDEFAYYVVHTLLIKKDDDEREVKHYYFSSWPDHGVPKYPTQLLAFRKYIRANHFEPSGPIIVHCSAGVGRTGVFLAIDMTLEKLEKGIVNSVDVFGQVLEMREKRMYMIQTLEQYIFVHEAILETILCGMNEMNSTNIKQEIKKLSEVQAGGMTGFEEKFKRLGDVSPHFSDEQCTAALLEGNQTRNRSRSIYPAESCRVGLRYVDGVENSDYINAVFVHGYFGKNYFIATQAPLPNTVDDFWRMVHEQNSSAIVLLNNVKDGTSFPKFWCSAKTEPRHYGNLTLRLESATEKNGIVTRTFILSAHADLHDGRVVNIFHYTKWPNHERPETANDVIELTSLVEKERQNAGKAPVIVACSNGAGRTGTFIAISNLLERMKVEQTVDVFQSVKIIRCSRPEFVENAKQFKFCYEAVTAYVDSFSEYANVE